MRDNVPESPEVAPATVTPLSTPNAFPPPASILSSPKRFPSPPLILMSVFSCFIATAAFSSAVFSLKALVIVPSAISFCHTVPYHVYLYLDAQKHRRSSTRSNPVFITPNCIIYGFLLVPFWVVVFVINIAFCIRIHDRRGVPIIVATVWAGLEWITLLFIALKCAREVWLVERDSPSITEDQSNRIPGAAEPNPDMPSLRKPRHLFLISFVLCTLTLVVSINISLVALANLIVFQLTAPYHIALYVASLRPRSPTPLFARRLNVPCALLLTALWCWVFVVNILVAHGLWRRILSGIFSGLEGLILIGLAARAVLDSFAEGQIKL